MQRPLQFHSPIHTLFGLCKRDSDKRCPSQRRHCCIALHCFLHGAPVNGCTLLICFRCSIARLRRQTVMAAATSSGHSIRNTCSIMASLPQSSSSAYRPPHTHTHTHTELHSIWPIKHTVCAYCHHCAAEVERTPTVHPHEKLLPPRHFPNLSPCNNGRRQLNDHGDDAVCMCFQSILTPLFLNTASAHPGH